jgi:nucleotide-binding universal stress UspA family protein
MVTHVDRSDADVDDVRFASILVPIDGSSQSKQAIDYAAQFRPDSIVLLQVEAEEPPRNHHVDAFMAWQRERVDTVAADLDRLAEAHASAAGTVRAQVRYGNPADQIIAEALDHDLVVMSSSGKSGAGRLLFGSVADRVVRHGVTPSVIVRAGKHEAAHGAVQRLVLPLDGSEVAERSVPVAMRAARTMALPIHLVRCVGMDDVLQVVREFRAAGDPLLENSGPDPYKAASARTEELASAYLGTLQQRIAGDGIEVTTEVLHGSAAFELIWSIDPSDLVVMTSRGRGGYERWTLGSVAEKLIREAKAPVLLVPVGRSMDAPRAT